MAGHATITFSQTGVQPPVYVTTSINDWTPVEMDVNEDKTASDNLIFRKEFNDVAEGSYQYKIRVGEDHWVLDESKETAATDDGIRNNVVHVKVASDINSLKSAPEATTVQETPPEPESLKASLANPPKIPEDRKDSTMGDQLSSVPVASMVVDKVEDQKQPAYGNTHHVDLPIDDAKRSADAESDYEETKVDSPIKTEIPKSPEVPLLVVDKTDDRPAYGDDFGEDATTAQKVAHDMRASDTQPDILTITPEFHTEPGDTEDDQAAPLFRHESFQADDDESQAPPKITVDDESTQSSTDQTSSGDAMDTPPEPEDGDELNLAPLLSHETELRGSVSEARDGLQVSHEGNDDEDDVDESGGAPLLPHETGFTEDDGADTESDDERNELDRYPLLSHESGFSDYKRSETLTKSEHSENREPQHYGAYGNEDDDEGNRDAEDDDTPLLPHERESAFVSSTGSDFSQDDAPFSLEKQPTFGYETDNARELFGAADRHDFFRGRTGSNLPHRLPQSDAEDQDLNDPSLERFPTNRESILARVATIGMHLPEDESMHERPHSPQPSVLSQACSSIDLVPVKSYASLASVPEDENSDEDEGYHHDLDSMPSPVYISHNTTRRSSPPARFVRDPYAASSADDNEQLGDAFDTKIDEPGSHTQESSEAESVAKHDGAKDISVAHSALLDAISAPVNMAKSATELVTSEPQTTTSEAHPVSNLDSELRQRRAVLEESSQTEEEMPESAADDVSITDKIVEAAKPALAQRSDYRRDNFLQHLFRAMFAACFGDRKRASASALVLGTTAATYYYAAKASR